ncbi:MAG: pyridoxal 5'-phosphate synthase glutaminase subunit PdxT [Anaerolineales bacterium]|nr:pyridoxal 5'-phosphate synthase glutaminase subunit PdxT [Anaerolineales bacterium]
MRIGVLALQGDFAEHIAVLHRLGVDAIEVRLPEHLESLDGLIIPGGESTTIGKLATTYNLMEPLRHFGEKRAIWGTCAGAIFLSRDAHHNQPLLDLMDISMERNAFGRQVDSFEMELSVHVLEDPDCPFHAIFIRAPIIDQVGKEVDVLASMSADTKGEERIVAAQQGRLLATSFHPELAGDDRFHKYFLELAKG